jgi:hypothetical protein
VWLRPCNLPAVFISAANRRVPPESPEPIVKKEEKNTGKSFCRQVKAKRD